VARGAAFVELLRLNVSDVLAVQANANGQHVVQITGTWVQNGTVTPKLAT
jgi:hypothetical protein